MRLCFVLIFLIPVCVYSGKCDPANINHLLGRKHFPRGVSGGKSLLNYRGLLVVLFRDGSVGFWNPLRKRWFPMDTAIGNLLISESGSIVALTRSGKIKVFQGTMGGMWDMDGGSFGGEVRYGGEMFSLLDTGITDVKSIHRNRGEDIDVQFNSGPVRRYGDIGPEIGDERKEFQYTLRPSLELTCRYGRGDYPVKEVILRKKRGELFATVRYTLEGTSLNRSPATDVSLKEIEPYLKDGPLRPSEIREIFWRFIVPTSQGSWGIVNCF